MSKKIKIISLLLSLVLLALCLTSCSYRAIKPTDEDVQVVGKVGQYDVLYDEFRFVVLTHKRLLQEQYGEGIFEGDEAEKYEDMLRENVYSNITSNYAVLSLCSEVAITRGNEIIIEAVDRQLRETVDSLGGMSEYKKYLKENNLTDNFLRFTTEVRLLEQELLYVYRDDLGLIETDPDKVYDIIVDEFICVKHIFIPESDEGSEALINEAWEALESGEDFDSVMSEYGKDEDMTSSGLLIPKGYMSDEYDAVAYSLRKGRYSEPQKLGGGYYIICREKIDDLRVMTEFSSLSELYQTYKFFSMIDSHQKTLEFAPSELGEGLKLSEIN